MQIVWIFLGSIILFMTACEQSGEDTQSQAAGEASDDFIAHLEYQDISPLNKAHRRKLYEDYLKKEALANKIEEEGLIDRRLLAAELKDIRNEIILDRYLKNYLSKAANDSRVLEFYNENIDRYGEKKARVAHILFRTHAGMTAENKKPILDKARQTLARIQAGESFADAAREISEDTASGARGGDLGWLEDGAINREFSRAAFALAEGEVSTEPVESNFGIHLIKMLEGPVVDRQSFDVVKADIRYELRSQARELEIARLLKESNVELDK